MLLVPESLVLVAVESLSSQDSATSHTLLQHQLYLLSKSLDLDLGFDAGPLGAHSGLVDRCLIQLQLCGLIVSTSGARSLFGKPFPVYQVTPEGRDALALLESAYRDAVRRVRSHCLQLRPRRYLDDPDLQRTVGIHWLLDQAPTNCGALEKLIPIARGLDPEQLSCILRFLNEVGTLDTQHRPGLTIRA